MRCAEQKPPGRERLRTEVDISKVASRNPGFCYMMAGWEKGIIKNKKLFLWAPMEAVPIGDDTFAELEAN